jgi:3-methylcrotonyl-CoA carboxylase alpha subunit
MEMNTRLQVEHPVTEMITGLDLVEWQLRVAAGEPLPLRQEQLAIDGWAFEARLYAEDASRGFLPATGRIDHLRFPGTPVRVESGVRAGDTVTPFYDPMIAKIITHGASRAEAHARMRAALTATQVAGTTTNIDFLKRLFLHDGFAAGDVDTGLIDRDIETLLTTSPMRAEAVALAALEASGMLAPEGRKPADPFDRLGPWCHWGAPERHISLTIGAGVVTLTLTRIGDATWTVSGWGDDALTLSAHRLDDRRVGFDIDGLRAQAQVVAHCVGQDPQSHKTGVTVFLDEVAYVFGIPPADLGDADNIASGDAVVAPMPGIVKQVLAATGQPVRRGEGLVIMEAMKMELTLAAPRDGSVAEVLVEAGAQVGEGAILIRLEQEIEQ